MTVLIVLLTVVEVLVALLLVLLVLVQRSRDEGLGMAFGNAMGESLFGAQAGTVLTKATVILGVVFIANTIMPDRLHSRGVRSGAGSVLDGVRDPVPAAAPVEAVPLVSDDGALSEVPAGAPLAIPTTPDAAPAAPAVAPEAPAAEAPPPAAAAPAPQS